MQIQVQKIDIEAVYALRNKVLRLGQPSGSCHYTEGHQISAFHLAVIYQQKIIGISFEFQTQAADICNKAGADLLWCNARVSALSFYRKLESKAFGKPFILDSIGEHIFNVSIA